MKRRSISIRNTVTKSSAIHPCSVEYATTEEANHNEVTRDDNTNDAVPPNDRKNSLVFFESKDSSSDWMTSTATEDEWSNTSKETRVDDIESQVHNEGEVKETNSAKSSHFLDNDVTSKPSCQWSRLIKYIALLVVAAYLVAAFVIDFHNSIPLFIVAMVVIAWNLWNIIIYRRYKERFDAALQHLELFLSKVRRKNI